MSEKRFLSNDIVETKLRCLEVAVQCQSEDSFNIDKGPTAKQTIEYAKTLLDWVWNEDDNLKKLNQP